MVLPPEMAGLSHRGQRAGGWAIRLPGLVHDPEKSIHRALNPLPCLGAVSGCGGISVLLTITVVAFADPGA